MGVAALTGPLVGAGPVCAKGQWGALPRVPPRDGRVEA